ncbi:MAG: hypothetical protein DDT20_00875 [Firmicutes bacterium]|nr:hypothetical protein [Bacillota bacterium]MBT9176555.1 hypothetical protein [Bacillota bacterium]
MRVGIRAKPHEIQIARLEKGLSQGEVATALGISRGYLSEIESGNRGLSPALARKICQLLGKKFGEIFEVVAISKIESRWKNERDGEKKV